MQTSKLDRAGVFRFALNPADGGGSVSLAVASGDSVELGYEAAGAYTKIGTYTADTSQTFPDSADFVVVRKMPGGTGISSVTVNDGAGSTGAPGGSTTPAAGSVTAEMLAPSLAGQIAAPAVLRGSYDLSRAPGLVLGTVDAAQRIANAAALQAAIAQCVENGRYAEAPPGRYEYTATMTQGGNNVGWQLPKDLHGFIGAGSGSVELVNFAVNHPAMTIGDVSNDDAAHTENAIYRGFGVGHGASQAGQTSAFGLLWGRIFFSDFDDIEVSPFFGGGHPYIGLRIGLASNQFFFSNRIGTISVRGGQQHVMHSVSNTTGNAWENAYFGGGWWGNRIALSSHAVFFAATGVIQGTFQQFNIEWTAPGESCYALRCDSLGIDLGSVNLEGNQLSGYNPAMVHSVDSRISIRQLRCLNNWIAAGNTSGMPRIFGVYDNGRIEVDQGSVFWDGAAINAEAVCSRPIEIAAEGDTSLIGRRPSIVLKDMTIGGAGLTGAVAMDSGSGSVAPGAAGFVSAIEEYRFHRARSSTISAAIEMANADMTVYAKDARCQVRATAELTANRSLTLSDRWASSGAGTQSTRRAGDIVQITRTGAANGAFDLLVKDHTGATLYTFAGAGSANTEKFLEWSGSAWFAL